MSATQTRWKKTVIRGVYLSIAPEFLCTAFLAFLGGAIVTATSKVDSGAVKVARIITVAFVDGFLFYGLIYLAMKLSYQTSGYLNPAFSIGLCIVNMYAHWNIWHIVRVLTYIVAQICGALVGVAMILAIVPNALDDAEQMGTAVPELVSKFPAFGGTVILSAFIMFVILSVRNNEGRMTSVILCFAYIAARIIAFPLGRGPLNPAISLAHAVVADSATAYTALWVDMGGASLGSIVAACCYLVWVRK